MTVQELIITLQTLPIDINTATVYIINEGQEVPAEEISYNQDSVTIDTN